VRLEVHNPEGIPHEMELPGSVVVVGRDPTCDLVLHDVKCSRRHAVIESGPDGITIRDTGSANGIYVNDQKVERAPLRPGDLVRMGDTTLRLLGEPQAEGTVIMTAEETPAEATLMAGTLDLRGPKAPVLPATIPPAAEAPSAPAGRAPFFASAAFGARPLTVSLLATLWLVSVPIYGLGGAGLAMRSSGALSALYAVAGLALAALSGVLAVGLWSLKPWARVLQIAVAAVGLLLCPFTMAAVVVLVYMLAGGGKTAFAGRPVAAPAGPREAAFAAALLGTVMLGGLITVVGLIFPLASRAAEATPGHRGSWAARLWQGTRAAERERLAALRLRRMAAAQEAFRQVCSGGYADLEALLDPRSVLPAYPADGPAFLDDPSFRQAEHDGYRFVLEVSGRTAASPGCPLRSYNRYRYLAQPLGAGRVLAVSADGVVRAAAGRAPVAGDPALR
jgi:hypothetical protein